GTRAVGGCGLLTRWGGEEELLPACVTEFILPVTSAHAEEFLSTFVYLAGRRRGVDYHRDWPLPPRPTHRLAGARPKCRRPLAAGRHRLLLMCQGIVPPPVVRVHN